MNQQPVADLLTYIDASPSPYHAAARGAEILRQGGFRELREDSRWELEAGQGYYLIRNDASLAAFRVPTGDTQSMRIIGAHTDSPNLRLKPIPEFARHGYTQLGVEVYGGALYNSWLDRDLGLSGRLYIRGADGVERRLIKIDSPLARVPQLAIHLDRGANDGLKLNAQKHLPPVIGLSAEPKKERSNRLFEMLAAEENIDMEAITGFDFCLHPLEPSRVSGLDGEFIHAPRLDNLAMCHAALLALRDRPANESTLTAIALFDNEEIGSSTGQGAASPFLGDVLERVFLSRGLEREAYLRGRSSALFLSADMAHAIHPNYPDRHDENHHPRINQGPVIKLNANQRYASDGATTAFLESLCLEREIPFQKFVNRTDLSCGSTIGPITASRLGIAVVDAGNPMLSMHSARELAGSQDPAHMLKLMSAFLES